MVFSHAYRLRRADGNGASVECSLVSRAAASALFLLRLAFAIVRSVIGDIRPAPRIAGRGGRADRFCLLAAVGSSGLVSFLSSACSFLARYRRPAHLVPVPVADTVSVPYPVACLVCPVACGRGRRFSPSIHRNVASACFVSVPFLVPCGCPFRFSSLFAPSCDTAGGELSCGGRSRVGSSPVPLLAVRGADRHVRLACYHFCGVLAVVVCCVGCVYRTTACRSCGIFVL